MNWNILNVLHPKLASIYFEGDEARERLFYGQTKVILKAITIKFVVVDDEMIPDLPFALIWYKPFMLAYLFS